MDLSSIAKRGVRSSVQTTVDNSIPRWDGTTGRVLQSTPHTIDDNGVVLLDQNSDFASLTIDSEATSANIIDILAPATTTGNVIDVGDANSLTTGKIANFVSNSATTDTRTLVQITNDNTLATGTTALTVKQDAAAYGFYLDHNANNDALVVESDAIGFNAIRVNVSLQTTASVLSIPSADSLTSGGIVNLVSNSTDVSSRQLFYVRNQNSAATGATVATFQQDAANRAVFIDQNADAIALSIDSEAATADVLDFPAPVTTTANVLDISGADSLTSGTCINVLSNSADTSVRTLVSIKNDNTLATSARCLDIVQDSTANGIRVTENGNGFAINIVSSATSSAALRFTTTAQNTGSVISIPSADSLTTGGALTAISNSSDTSTRTLMQLTNDNTLATGATVATLQQDSTANNLFIDTNGNAQSLEIDSEATSVAVIQIASPTSQTAPVFRIINADSLTSAGAFYLHSDSSSTGTRNLVNMINDNVAAVNTTLLNLQQDSSSRALNVSAPTTAYQTLVGIVEITRSGNLTGVDTETIVDLDMRPSFTLTEPAGGSVNYYGANIDMSSVSVTAGAGTSVLAALNLVANADADVGTNLALRVASGVSAFGGNITPLADDGAQLGTTSLKWSDLFLASGSVINFNSGDVLITHSANTLAFTGGTNYTFDDSVTMSGEVVADGTTTSSGAGAVGITGSIHEITTTGIGDALTLANGTEGQRLFIVYVAEGAGTDSAVLTPTSMGNGTTVTFGTVGNNATAVFTNGKWYFSAQGAVIA